MKFLIDTNVILDHLLDRKPFNKAATKIFSAAERGQFEFFIGGTTVTTIHYLLAKWVGAARACQAMEQLLQIFEIAAITRTV
ncbi:MAG TPA: PIN domain-containing protein, partial [Gammaproteobacteria bacterium]|nr:PIN domain-containing protein [Gammaproteobacteria bacterium]